MNMEVETKIRHHLVSLITVRSKNVPLVDWFERGTISSSSFLVQILFSFDQSRVVHESRTITCRRLPTDDFNISCSIDMAFSSNCNPAPLYRSRMIFTILADARNNWTACFLL